MEGKAMKTTRVPTPPPIEGAMKLWRKGLVALPQSYVDFHRTLAEAAVDGLKKSGLIIHRTFMAFDGWMDGMETLVVIAERRRGGELLKLQWNDGSQVFFHRLPGNRGSVPFRPYLDPYTPEEGGDAAVQDGQ